MRTKTETVTASSEPDREASLRQRLQRLGLHGLLAQFSQIAREPWLERLCGLEEEARSRRSLERRLYQARIGAFKPMADFDWQWPKVIDRPLVDDLLSLDFLAQGANVLIVGPSGVGKTMIAQNLLHQAVRQGHTARFTSASALLCDLGSQESASALRRRLRHYAAPRLLAIDEVGYLSESNRDADLLFELLSLRYLKQPVVVTTNKPFDEWNQVFPNASCVVALVDRLVHNAEILKIEGESYRLKEANERARERERLRSERQRKSKRS
jgi:DNA replication protein DnaC